MRNRYAWLGSVVALGLAAACATPARGIDEKGDKPWSVTTKVGPDAQVGGWFVNLGLTAIALALLARV